MKDFRSKWRKPAVPGLPPAELDTAAPDAPINWQAELGREFGVRLTSPAWAAAPELPAESLEPLPDWKAEYARDMGLEPPRRRGPEPAADGQGVLSYSSAAGFSPEMVPRDFEAYKRLLHPVMDPARHRLAQQMVQQPAFRSAFQVWRPGQVTTNLNVMYIVYDRISALMGQVYGFTPAPLGYEPGMKDTWGLYSRRHRRVMIAEKLLYRPVEDLFATIIHEQIHKLQHVLTLRLDFPSEKPLTLPERCLAYYWKQEEPRLARYYARAFNDLEFGRGDAAYRRIGVEYHAFDTEEYVVPILTRAFR